MTRLDGFGWIGALVLFHLTTGIASPAQGFKTLVRFDGPDGTAPRRVSLVQGRSGRLYGTTALGGAHDRGTVFRLGPAGHLVTLYDFCAAPSCSDGAEPNTLQLGTDGDFYGTTYAGGSQGLGTVFKITAQGVLTT